MEMLKGRFVRSLSGRDKGQVLLVIGVCDNEKMLLIADGKTRKLETAKIKKKKHVLVLDVPRYGEEIGMLTNRKLRAAIKQVNNFLEQKE